MTEFLLKLTILGITAYYAGPQSLANTPIVGPELRQYILYATPCIRDFYADIHPGPYPFPLDTAETLCWSCESH